MSSETFDINKAVKAVRGEEAYEKKLVRLSPLVAALGACHKCSKGDKKKLYDFFIADSRATLEAYSKCETHREKDRVAAYGESLLRIPMLLQQKGHTFPDYEMAGIVQYGKWLKLINEFDEIAERCLDKEKVESRDAQELISSAVRGEDEYYRGKLYDALLKRRNSLGKLPPEAKKTFATHMATEMNRYLKEQTLSEDMRHNFVKLADISAFFADERLTGFLKKAMLREESDVAFFAFQSLLSNGYCSEEAVSRFAADTVHSSFTYRLLLHAGKDALFPEEYRREENLYMSDLAYWLTFPSQLGKQPDEIEFFGRIPAANTEYFVYKYRSDSENLEERLRGEWLLGWAGRDRSVFTKYDKLSDYDKGDAEKALQLLKKKCLH